MAKIRNLEIAGYANLAGPGLLDVKKYGAKGDFFADDSAAISAAISDAYNNAQGGVLLPPGSYRLNAGAIVGMPNVSVYGVPGRTFIFQDHASHDTFSYTHGPQDQNTTYISGIAFQGNIANSGAIVHSTADMRLNIENCTYNSGAGPYNLSGPFLYSSGSGFSQYTIRDCFMRPGDPFSALMVTGNPNAFIRVDSNYLVMSDGYLSSMFPLSQGRNIISNNYFDLTEHSTGGGAACVYVVVGGAYPQTINGNVYYSSGGPLVFSLAADSGAWVVSSGNTYTGAVTTMNSAFLDARSKVDLTNLSYGATGGTTMTVPDCVETFSAQFSSTAPTLTMPTKLFPGQEITITVRNASAGFWAGVGVTNLNGPLIGGVSGGQAVTFTARVMTTRANGSTWAWTMIGQYATAFTTT